jgi:hypothetical protein
VCPTGAGYLYDAKIAQLEIAERFIGTELPKLVKTRAGAVAGRVVMAKTLEPAIADAWMETVPAILASNKFDRMWNKLPAGDYPHWPGIASSMATATSIRTIARSTANGKSPAATPPACSLTSSGSRRRQRTVSLGVPKPSTVSQIKDLRAKR